ncbi:hypothetical protein VTN00DRAFT_9406 [Thermoascus crustaceus]|uniref:uncharacterized protein n=1 Tax=Thermoascus crustaceus TaxID=5088 RepID=UPI003743033F
MAEKADAAPTYPPQGYIQGPPMADPGVQVPLQGPPPGAPLPAQQASSSKWSSSFWDCCSPADTCLCGWCLPCFLFGKTQARMKDPSLKNFSYCNGDCCLWLCLGYCGASWVLQTIKRGEMRERYGIEGSCCGDCMRSWCCPCCGLVQEEKEAQRRIVQEAPGYQPPQGMTYPQF